MPSIQSKQRTLRLAARLGNGWRVFLLSRLSLASELCRVKEQPTNIVALHKLYVVLRTHSNIINFTMEDITTQFNLFLLFYYNLSISGNCCWLFHLGKQSRALT